MRNSTKVKLNAGGWSRGLWGNEAGAAAKPAKYQLGLGVEYRHFQDYADSPFTGDAFSKLRGEIRGEIGSCILVIGVQYK